MAVKRASISCRTTEPRRVWRCRTRTVGPPAGAAATDFPTGPPLDRAEDRCAGLTLSISHPSARRGGTDPDVLDDLRSGSSGRRAEGLLPSASGPCGLLCATSCGLDLPKMAPIHAA